MYEGGIFAGEGNFRVYGAVRGKSTFWQRRAPDPAGRRLYPKLPRALFVAKDGEGVGAAQFRSQRSYARQGGDEGQRQDCGDCGKVGPGVGGDTWKSNWARRRE